MLCLIASARAQQPAGIVDPSALKSYTLEELTRIQITSVTKEPATAFRTPAAIRVLTSDQILQSGARTIPDLLRLIPGVNVAQIDSNSWAIGIRGFESGLSRSVLVLIDGRSVYTPLFRGVYWNMQDVLIEDIDRIEVIDGPGGTIWGSNAVNGVINIITQNSRDTHGMMVSAQGGNVEQGALNWRYGGGDDDFSYRIYGKGFTRAPEVHPDSRSFDDWRRGQTGFRTDAHLSDRDELTVQGDVYGGEAGEALQISTYAPPAITTNYGNSLFNGENILAAWRRRLKSGDIQVVGYWDRTNRRDLNYQEIRNTFDIDFIHHIALGRNDVTWGAGARISPDHFSEVVPTVLFTPARDVYNIFSGFVQDEIAIVPERLSFTLGSKFEHTSYSGFDYQPSGRIAWTPGEKQTIWAAVTRAVRTASRIEQGFDFTALQIPSLPLYIRLIGDNHFSPEQLIGYEAGYRTSVIPRLVVGLTLFHNRYDDLLSVENQAPFVETTPSPTHLVLPLYLRNGIAANSNGGELVVVWDPAPRLRLRGSYSTVFIDGRRRPGSDDASTVRQLEGDSPRHVGVVNASVRLHSKLDLNLTYRAVSSIPDVKVPAYSTADARLGWQVGGDWTLELVGQNLLQPSHLEYSGLPGGALGIRRSIFGGVMWGR
jgi:iron complex outermembrane receptor protein